MDTKNALVKAYRHRVFIIDQPIVCLGLRALFSSLEDIEICGGAATAHAAQDAIGKLAPPPELVIMDLALRQSSGISLLQNLVALHPALRILVFSGKEERIFGPLALRAGACGYVSKHAGYPELRKEFYRAIRGECVVSEALNALILDSVIARRSGPNGLPLERLSPRELEVLELLGQGHGTREVAELLHISVKTVESHRAHLKDKLGLKNANELVQQAIAFSTVA